jgi:hypothetical protein
MAGRVRVREISDDEGNRLTGGEPAIRLMTRRDVLGEQATEDAR